MAADKRLYGLRALSSCTCVAGSMCLDRTCSICSLSCCKLPGNANHSWIGTDVRAGSSWAEQHVCHSLQGCHSLGACFIKLRVILGQSMWEGGLRCTSAKIALARHRFTSKGTSLSDSSWQRVLGRPEAWYVLLTYMGFSFCLYLCLFLTHNTIKTKQTSYLWRLCITVWDGHEMIMQLEEQKRRSCKFYLQG